MASFLSIASAHVQKALSHVLRREPDLKIGEGTPAQHQDWRPRFHLLHTDRRRKMGVHDQVADRLCIARRLEPEWP